MSSDNVYKFIITASQFARRARTHLERFDAQADVEELLDAALALRMAIEARAYEYIGAALRQLHPQRAPEESGIRHHEPAKLLKELFALDPNSDRPAGIVLRRIDDKTGRRVSHSYLPISPDMVRLHGELGGLLHFTYFWTHPAWWAKSRATPGAAHRQRTLTDARDVVATGMTLVEEHLARGSLLASPALVRRIEELELAPPDPDGD